MPLFGSRELRPFCYEKHFLKNRLGKGRLKTAHRFSGTGNFINIGWRAKRSGKRSPPRATQWKQRSGEGEAEEGASISLWPEAPSEWCCAWLSSWAAGSVTLLKGHGSEQTCCYEKSKYRLTWMLRNRGKEKRHKCRGRPEKTWSK